MALAARGEDVKAKLQAWMALASGSDRCACVTSGGTTVPLEKNMVRFLDNFSLGERGASSAECFLAHGFRVVFLYRATSIVPFTRGFRKEISQHMNNGLLEHLEVVPEAVDGAEASIRIAPATVSNYPRLVSELACHQACVSNQSILMIPFESVLEYLALLEVIAKGLGRAFSSHCLFYLAAAVSDFYLPPEHMAEHKIQSHGGKGGLVLELSNVPKTLGKLVADWAPRSFIVSFKLETDKKLVISKAQRAIENYGVHLVVANQLQTRREVVFLVSLAPTTGSLAGGGDDAAWGAAMGAAAAADAAETAAAATTATAMAYTGEWLLAPLSPLSFGLAGRRSIPTRAPASPSAELLVEEVHRAAEADSIDPAIVERVIARYVEFAGSAVIDTASAHVTAALIRKHVETYNCKASSASVMPNKLQQSRPSVGAAHDSQDGAGRLVQILLALGAGLAVGCLLTIRVMRN